MRPGRPRARSYGRPTANGGPDGPHDPARWPRHRPEPGHRRSVRRHDRGRPDRVARTAGTGPPPAGGRVEDVTGLLVTPGLIDLHGHWYEGSPYGIDPMANLRGGVTTAVDAGTAGFSNFGDVPPAHDRDRPGPGPRLRPRRGRRPGHDASSASSRTSATPARARPRPSSREHRDVVVGVKVRLGTGACGDNVAAALDAALEAAELAGVAADGPHRRGRRRPRRRSRRLRPGDIVTHAFTASGPGILGDDGRILPEAHDAAARGVRFDVGHGCGSFSWATAGAGAGRGPRARRDQHRPPPLLDRAAGRRPADDDVALPRPRAVARRGRRGDDRRPGGDPRAAGARARCAPAARPTSRVLRARRRRRSSCPTRRASAGPSAARLVPVWTIAGGVLHRAARRRAPPAAATSTPTARSTARVPI